jgi:hypothetical protein
VNLPFPPEQLVRVLQHPPVELVDDGDVDRILHDDETDGEKRLDRIIKLSRSSSVSTMVLGASASGAFVMVSTG